LQKEVLVLLLINYLTTAMTSLLFLIDDIASQLDDIALLSKTAAQKTTGVLGDDLALNAQQVSGVSPERELHIVFSVFKGSLLNKAILVPSAMGISIIAPWFIKPLLIVGGVYLCFEGVEKLVHKWLHRVATDDSHNVSKAEGSDDSNTTVKEYNEKEKVAGAIRTDFVLSAEIVTIALGMAQGSSLINQFFVLVIVALLMTIGVYGLVACIVKIDDVGLFLYSRKNNAPLTNLDLILKGIGANLIRIMPWLMRALSVAGTVAVFLVGGGIIVHGISWFHHIRDILPSLFDASIGVLSGLLVLVAMMVFKFITKKAISN
jgi:uncharacterized protein